MSEIIGRKSLKTPSEEISQIWCTLLGGLDFGWQFHILQSFFNLVMWLICMCVPSVTQLCPTLCVTHLFVHTFNKFYQRPPRWQGCREVLRGQMVTMTNPLLVESKESWVIQTVSKIISHQEFTQLLLIMLQGVELGAPGVGKRRHLANIWWS